MGLVNVRYGISVWFTIVWREDNESAAHYPFNGSGCGTAC
jgi:hypothetical protein